MSTHYDSEDEEDGDKKYVGLGPGRQLGRQQYRNKPTTLLGIDWGVENAARARRFQKEAHDEDERFPPPDDLAYMCYGRRGEDQRPVAPLEDRDAARKRKEKEKRDEERLKKQTQHTRDIRGLFSPGGTKQ